MILKKKIKRLFVMTTTFQASAGNPNTIGYPLVVATILDQYVRKYIVPKLLQKKMNLVSSEELRVQLNDLGNVLYTISITSNNPTIAEQYVSTIDGWLESWDSSLKVNQDLLQQILSNNQVIVNSNPMNQPPYLIQTDSNLKTAKFGGNVKEDVKFYKYQPPALNVGNTVQSTCGLKTKTVNNPAMFFGRCERSEIPGVKKCEIQLKRETRQEMVPITCATKNVQVVNGAQVTSQTTNDMFGNTIVKETVEPQVTNVKLQTSFIQKNEQPITFERASRKYDTVERKAAGAAQLPMRKKEFKLNELDIANQPIAGPEGMMLKPDAWVSNVALKNMEFATLDNSYGTTSLKARQRGFPFAAQDLPYEALNESEKEYMAWLVSVSVVMRNLHPDIYEHLFDPVLDTIATMESYILIAIGRLEAQYKMFDRFAILDIHLLPKKLHNMMNPTLYIYATAERTNIWISPLSMRYIEIPSNYDDDDDKNDYKGYPGEFETLTALDSFYQGINSKLKEGIKIDDSSKEMVLLPVSIEMKTDNNEKGIMDIMETKFLALLARIQYLAGYAVNTNFDSFKGFVENLLKPEHSKYLKPTTVAYLRMFQMENNTEAFIYLPKLREEQAKQSGKQMPFQTPITVKGRWKDFSDVNVEKVLTNS